MNQLRVIILSCLVSFLLIPFTVTVAENTPNNSMLLSETEINQKIETLPEWTTDGKVISRTFEFKDFVTAIDFVNQLVAPAESAGHHPDLAISYNKVTVSLTTHDAGGLTALDFSLAEKISQLAN
ncbi:putative pterin-4-alpha-carbinolamine dehydratase [Hyella patelloides LEGE 07179]|uniref:Putative pterin-4-alpha-carbinolamine dehydratase n=1 Tax=Hyella patelloides LEGE 07179 TaxID=945734 RepID=A0A563W036_9CYAN|nr:4a-hydroxytetrahydrobiopterin dehydratase [Hyella patelloides]VEP16987.1 putative pterin-4-alpha-carbinolamine dehydratase [Hyella patelloides LEGE 07179]